MERERIKARIEALPPEHGSTIGDGAMLRRDDVLALLDKEQA